MLVVTDKDIRQLWGDEYPLHDETIQGIRESFSKEVREHLANKIKLRSCGDIMHLASIVYEIRADHVEARNRRLGIE